MILLKISVIIHVARAQLGKIGFMEKLTLLSKDDVITSKELADGLPKYFIKEVSLPWQKSENLYLHVRLVLSSENNVKFFIKESNSAEVIDEKHFSEFDISLPIELSPIEIPKPWGKEVWYTGIEERGVSLAKVGSSLVRISSILSTFGSLVMDEKSPQPILLKVLAPNSHPERGNLYYELHVEKQEVYIVSGINNPDGKTQGRMKYGINAKKLKEYESEESFKTAFKSSIKSYEKIRTEVESTFDKFRENDCINLTDSLTTKKLDEYYSKLPGELRQAELNAKKKVEEFVGWKTLKIGDVVAVETHVPHSLQHGVEVIEFQTPVYERRIISFDQKVLTQKNWDVDAAFEVMKLSAPLDAPLKVLDENKSYKVEEVVKFSGFAVNKIHFESSYKLESSNSHSLIFVLENDVLLASGSKKMELFQGKAYFVPSCSAELIISPNNKPSCSVLVASPQN